MTIKSFTIVTVISLLLCIKLGAAALSQDSNYTQGAIQLTLNGTEIASDGFVDVNDIGEHDSALLCQTNKTDCCRYYGYRSYYHREWYFPNGSRVGTFNSNYYIPNHDFFYRDRGQQVVRLNRRGNPSERGRFCCVVPDENDINRTIFVNIVNIGPGGVNIFPSSPVTATADTKFTLNCSADITPNPLPPNVPTPNFEWFFGPNNSSLPSGVTVYPVSKSGNTYTSTLQFSPLQKFHTGIFTCQLGGNSKLVKSIVLTVNDGAIQLTHNGIAIASDGFVDVNDIGEYNRALLCQTNKTDCCRRYYGNRSLGEWYFPNGSQVESWTINTFYIQNHDFFYRDRGQQVVRLNRLRNPSERGRFCCVVPDENDINRTIFVNIVNIGPGGVNIFPSSPVTATADTKFTLNCSADITPNPLPPNVPTPSFEWFFGPNNSSLPSGVTVSPVSKSGNTYTSTLRFSPLQKFHSGIFTCQLGGNSKLVKSIVLTVNAIVNHPMNATVYGNRPVVFNVLVVGNSASFTYQWQKDGLDLTEMVGKFEGVNTKNLTIKAARNIDEGWYRCVIRYGTGNRTLRSNEAFLNVVDIPNRPVFTGGSRTSTSIYFAWKEDPASVILWYELQYNFRISQCLYNSNTRTVNISLRHDYTLTSSTETPVEEDSSYLISLRAVNSDGISSFTTTQAATLGAAPTEGPRNLIGSCNKRDRAITIQWESIECKHRNGEIVGYNVTYYPSSDIAMSETVTVSESVHTFTTTRLMCNTDYIYKVQAFSEEYGSGPPTTITLKTLLLEGIVHRNRSYENNSVIHLDSTAERVLQCFIEKSGCCDFEADGGGGEGEWFFPNRSSLRTMSHGDDIYSNRGEGVVNLNWKESQNTVIPTGIFCCKIHNPNQTKLLCIGAYPDDEGVPIVVTVTTDTNTHSLICTSTGGPATNVTWRKNGQAININRTNYHQTKRIAFTENATYETTLHFPDGSIDNYNAMYECLVMNSRGNDSLRRSLKALQVISTNLSSGQNETITCSSIIPVDVMEWLNSDGEIIANESNTGQLNLTFDPISIHNKQHTCKANKNGSVLTLSVLALNIVTHPMNQTVYGNRQAMFNVTVIGNSTSFTYHWQKDGLDLTEMEGKFEGVNTSNLTIKRARKIDEGWYRCVIRYGTGNGILTSNEAFLNVVDIPRAPVFTGGSWNSTSINITWKEDPASVVLWYEVQYNFRIRQCPYNEESPNSGTILVNISLRHNYTLTNSTETPVEEDSIYQLNLRAVNSDGISRPASAADIPTLGATPTQAPRNLIGSCNKRDRAITIQWESIECRHRNGEIAGYNVTYYPSSDMEVSESLTVSEYVHTFSATGLICNTEYEYKVQGFSEKYGTGPQSSITLKALLLQGIVLGDRSYDNNSVIHLDSTERVLQCFTEKSGCCDFETGRGAEEGEWFFPNRSIVKTISHGGDIYSSRGEGVVNLNWRENATIPSGIFCCEIHNLNQTIMLCIGVYPEDEGIPVVVDHTYDPHVHGLVCTSTGGPATNVTWRKIGKAIDLKRTSYHQTKRIAFTENATYETTLHIPDHSIENYNATYECFVMNSRGNDSLRRSVEALQIDNKNLSIGQNGATTCSSMIPVDVIEWLNSDGEIIVREANTEQLTLTFDPINISIHNRQYTCRAYKNGSVNKTITLSVSVKDDTLTVETNVPKKITSIGEMFTVNCSAKVIAGVIKSPVLTLKHPNGTRISSVVGRELSVVFHSVRATDAGEYTCVGEIVLPELDNLSLVAQSKENVTLKFPELVVEVRSSGNISVGLHDFKLTCNATVSRLELLDATISYQWIKNNGTQIQLGSKLSYLFFPTVRLSHAGLYTCLATVNSPYLHKGGINSTSSPFTVHPSVPQPVVRLVSSASNPILSGSSPTLTCTVELNPAVDVPLDITTLWSGPDGSTLTSDASPVMRSFTHYTTNVTLKYVESAESGTYTCTVMIRGKIRASVSKEIIIGVHLSLKGVIYPNNSVIYLTEIEQTNTTSNNGLQCITDRRPCCTARGTGEWFFPDNGGMVPLQSAATTFYQSRGNNGTVNLNRLNTDVMMPTGRFCCVVVNATSVPPWACAIIIHSHPILSLTSNAPNPHLSGSNITLTCTVELNPIVDVPVTVNTVLTGPNSTSSTLNHSSTIRESLTLYWSENTLDLVQSTDSGKYTCTVKVGNGIEMYTSTSIKIVDGMFQLRLKGIDICKQWYIERSSKEAIKYVHYIQMALVEAIERNCKCHFPFANFLEDSFSCEDSSDLMTYRGTLIGTHNFNGTRILGFIQDWVSSSPRIKIDRGHVRVDSSCPVALTSLNEPECKEKKGCLTSSDDPNSFTVCAEQLGNRNIATCFHGCIANDGYN